MTVSAVLIYSLKDGSTIHKKSKSALGNIDSREVVGDLTSSSIDAICTILAVKSLTIRHTFFPLGDQHPSQSVRGCIEVEKERQHKEGRNI